MFFEKTKDGYILRVRLMPNSSLTKVLGKIKTPDGADCLKIGVTVVPEKGKANEALVEFLAKSLKQPKSAFEIIFGKTDRLKKVRLNTKENLDKRLHSFEENGK